MSDTKVGQPSETMLSHLGMATLHWSYIEASIDALVAITYHTFDGNKLETKLPRMLGPKIDYLLKVFGRHPELAKLQERAASLLGAVSTLSDRRHVLIHGYAAEFEPKAIKFVKLRIEPQVHLVEQHTVTEMDLFNLVDQSGDLALHLALFVQPMATELLKHLPDETSGNFPI